jgi:hypothetical protein
MTEIAFYKCPFCEFKAAKLCGIKEHVRRKHLSNVLAKCPACGRRYNNIRNHFYMHAYRDDDHLVLCYLFTKYKLNSVIGRVKELLKSEGGQYEKK